MYLILPLITALIWMSITGRYEVTYTVVERVPVKDTLRGGSGSAATGSGMLSRSASGVAMDTLDDEDAQLDREDAGEQQRAVSLDAQRSEHLARLEAYVLGIVTDFQAFPLQRIHSSLQVAHRTDSSMTQRVSESELQQVLDRLVQEDKLELLEGFLYKRKASKR